MPDHDLRMGGVDLPSSEEEDDDDDGDGDPLAAFASEIHLYFLVSIHFSISLYSGMVSTPLLKAVPSSSRLKRSSRALFIALEDLMSSPSTSRDSRIVLLTPSSRSTVALEDVDEVGDVGP